MCCSSITCLAAAQALAAESDIFLIDHFLTFEHARDLIPNLRAHPDLLARIAALAGVRGLTMRLPQLGYEAALVSQAIRALGCMARVALSTCLSYNRHAYGPWCAV